MLSLRRLKSVKNMSSFLNAPKIIPVFQETFNIPKVIRVPKKQHFVEFKNLVVSDQIDVHRINKNKEYIKTFLEETSKVIRKLWEILKQKPSVILDKNSISKAHDAIMASKGKHPQIQDQNKQQEKQNETKDL